MRRNGWQNVDGTQVYVEDGRVVFGLKKGRSGQLMAASPFIMTRCGWVYAGRISLSTFRAGMRQNTIILM